MNAVFSLFTRRFFWPVVAVTVATSIMFSAHYFTHNNPIAMLAIRMDRTEAIALAKEIHTKEQWLPENARTAVQFEEDTDVQYFVELECGGADAFATMLKEHTYEAFTWHVRHFQEKSTHESHLYFTPEGKPYGFSLKLPETEERPSLSVEEARNLARSVAEHDWNILFDDYKEVEASKKTQPSKRVDHTFVYEKQNETVGTEGRYRIYLEVSGNLVSQVMPAVFVPETFSRKFEELRTSNSMIYLGGNIGLLMLYVFCGILLGGFYLIRRKLVIFRSAFYWSAGIGLLQALSIINQLPLVWMSYDTATSINSFLSLYAFSVIAAFGGTTIALGFIFSICLTWDRLGFRNHLRFWNLWSPTVGASKEVLWITLIGFVYAIVSVAESTGISMLFADIFAWWSPSGALSNPNILATYAPWLGALTASLQAGFMEEALFRALPIAGAVIAGRYFKKERLGLCLGFIVQGLIFAACHANYPQMPGYYRLLELQSCSLIFGLLYLYWGLLPGIIAHFLYDFFLMGLPVLVSQGSTALFNKIIMLFIVLAPLIIILVRRMQRGSWYKPTEEDFNSIKPTEQSQSSTSELFDQYESPAFSSFSSLKTRIILVAALVGIALLVIFTPVIIDNPPLTITKTEALEVSQTAFEQQTVLDNPDLEFTPYCFIAALPSQQEKFIWQTQSTDVYHHLEGLYLTPPSWVVRYCSFTGPVAERSTEFLTLVHKEQEIFRSKVVLPEHTSGLTLLEGEARGIALQAVQDHHGISVNSLREVSAISEKKPNRLDWIFTFEDTREKLKADGQARIAVTIAGDTVTNITRSIFVPEEWTREQQQYMSYVQQFALLLAGLFWLLYFLSLAYINKTIFSHLNLKKSTCLTIIFLLLMLFAAWNKFEPIIGSAFTTTQPFITQAITFFSSTLVSSLFIFSFIGAYLIQMRRGITSIIEKSPKAALLACSLVLFTVGLEMTIFSFLPKALPIMGDFLPFDRWSLLATLALTYLFGFIYSLSFNSIFVFALSKLQKTYAFSYKTLIPLLFLLGFVINAQSYVSNSYMSTTLVLGLVGGLIFTLLYLVLIQHDQSMIVMTTATTSSLTMIIKGVQRSFPGALPASLLIAFIGLMGAYLFFVYLRSKRTIANN